MLKRNAKRLLVAATVLASGALWWSTRVPGFLAIRGLNHVERSVNVTIAGVATTAELYSPRDRGKHPCVVLLYGSGGMDSTEIVYRWYAAALADRGMVTIICPYFDSTHGRQHREPANTRVWVPAVVDCITYVRSLPDVDAGRVGIIGFSLGGFVGMSTIAQDHRVKAFVDFFGPEPKLSANQWKTFPPTLILHGDADTRVGISNARNVAQQLKSAGVFHELIIYPGQHHGFTGTAAIDAHMRAINFLATELRSQ
jgi:dipeptidyl aminopeptidase/acylaminoacyl peptidase